MFMCGVCENGNGTREEKRENDGQKISWKEHYGHPRKKHSVVGTNTEIVL